MSTLTTKVTITLAAAVTGVGAASPAFADDGIVAAATPQETIAHAVRWGGQAVAVVAGIVLLMKLLQSYRRSQWRRQWLHRSTVLYVGSAQLGWPTGSISGRSTRPPAGLSSMTSPLAGSSVARSATRL